MIIHYLNILNEGAVDDKIKRYIREYTLNDNKEILDFKVEDLNEDYKNYLQQVEPTLYDSCIRNNLRYLDFCRLYLLKYFDISHNKGPIEYVLGIARIACSELGMFNENYDNSSLMLFKQIVLFIHNNPTKLQTSYDKNLNGKTFNELKKEVNNIRREFNQNRREALKNIPKRSIKSDYKVIPITCKEDAYKFAKYTDWCVTRDNHYSSYAKNGARFYFCLKNGFENIERKETEGCPLDEYGLSMISVLIDMEGEPLIITTRWNHANDGENNENLKTPEQFEQLTGIPFFDTFKPYTKEELKEMGIVSFDELENRLNNGENPLDVFSFCETIYLNSIDNNILLVKANDKYNFIDVDNNPQKLLSDKWFNIPEAKYDIFKRINAWNIFPAIPVHYGNKSNFFDLKNKCLISDIWYNEVDPFFSKCNVARVISYDKNLKALMNFKGEIISDWYDELECVDNVIDTNYYIARKNNKSYVINSKGNVIIGDFDSIRIFFNYKNEKREYRGSIVEKNGKYNIIDDNIKFLSDKWYNSYEYIYRDDKNNKLYKMSEEKLKNYEGIKLYAIALINSIENKDYVLI